MATYYGIPTSDETAKILETSGIGNGAKFGSADDVRDYFTVASFTVMFGECADTQDALDDATAFLINHHIELPDICAF